MTIQTHLDELRDALAGCRIAAFGDLSSGLILRSSTTKPVARETLDQLCEDATWCFKHFENSLGSGSTDVTNYGQAAIKFTALETQVFVRHPTDPTDVTCAAIEPSQDIEEALMTVRLAAFELGSSA